MRYEDHPGVNPSSLKVLARKSPLHYKWSLTHPREETDAMRFGTAVHCAVLQPDVYAARYATRPKGLKFTTADGKAWRQEQGERVILDTDEGEKIAAIVEALRSSRVAGPYLAHGRVEQPIYWTDPDFNFALKGRPDLVTDTGILVDLKTARDLSPHKVASQAIDLGYLFSAAMYFDGLTANGTKPRGTVLVYVETAAPFDVVVYRLDDDALSHGRDEYKAALEKLTDCLETGEWPGRFPDVTPFVIPRWATPEEESDDVADYRQTEEG